MIEACELIYPKKKLLSFASMGMFVSEMVCLTRCATVTDNRHLSTLLCIKMHSVPASPAALCWSHLDPITSPTIVGRRRAGNFGFPDRRVFSCSQTLPVPRGRIILHLPPVCEFFWDILILRELSLQLDMIVQNAILNSLPVWLLGRVVLFGPKDQNLWKSSNA